MWVQVPVLSTYPWEYVCGVPTRNKTSKVGVSGDPARCHLLSQEEILFYLRRMIVSNKDMWSVVSEGKVVALVTSLYSTHYI